MEERPWYLIVYQHILAGIGLAIGATIIYYVFAILLGVRPKGV